MGVNNRHRRRAKKLQRERRGDRNRSGHLTDSPPRRGGAGARVREPDADLVRRHVLAAADSCQPDDREREQAFARLLSLRERVGFGAVDDAVTWWVDLATDRLWNEGWQPADVMRVLGREVGNDAAAAVTSQVGSSAARRPEASSDGRWAAQLQALREAPGAGRDGGTPGWERRLHDAVRALGLLLHLGPLPRLGRTRGHRPGGGADAVLERVRALLAKAESTEFPEEAEAFTGKAHELMARHAIDAAMLDGHGTRDSGTDVIGWRIPVDDPYASPKSLLLSGVATANRCHSVHSGGLGFSTVFGTEADLEIVELLFTSLLVQATEAMVRAGRSVDRTGRSRTRSFRQSFLISYAVRIGERLDAVTQEAVADGERRYEGALLPVLVSREQAVAEAVNKAFPGAVNRRFNIANGAGYVAGRVAADVASLAVGGALPEAAAG